MHHMDADKMYWEKTRQLPHKNATSYAERILKAIPHETTTVQPLTSHLSSYPSKTNKAYEALLEKQVISNPFTWTL